jgi:hypothetical protein
MWPRVLCGSARDKGSLVISYSTTQGALAAKHHPLDMTDGLHAGAPQSAAAGCQGIRSYDVPHTAAMHLPPPDCSGSATLYPVLLLQPMTKSSSDGTP